ncbi:MAG: CCA tRNA nucleotidyltransferase [Nitrososphaeraceae archaeon]
MTTLILSVTSRALRYLQPSARENEKLTRIAHKVMELVRNYPSLLITDVVSGGSFAKGTWVKGEADLDVFVKIDPSVDKVEFERLGMAIGLQSLRKYKTQLRYSEHPYVEAFINGVRVNIVPCYDVEWGKWKSAADRSPFHTEYINNHLDSHMKQEVRLLKKFLKTVGIYGAQIAKGGLSGYVTEILILKYGTFVSTLQSIADIASARQIISVNKVDNDVLKTFESNIVIIDPVDPRRNLGTAISPESLGKFILASRAFIHRPYLHFFGVGKNRKPRNVRLDSNLLIIEFKYEPRSPDIIWGQLKKTLNSISKQLQLSQFDVIRSTCTTDEKGFAALVFLLRSVTLPSYTERIGPDVFRKKESANFVSKNAKESLLIWTNREMRLVCLFKTKVTNAKDFLHSLFSERLGSIGITEGLKEDIRNGTLKIYTGDEKGMISGIVRHVVKEVTATERFITDQH